ncbi:protein phosphatase regulator [Mucor velutinosus]|uniref:Protein phosphatase regulator n=1 Tax=Mucor velutinosus TaxID=708070 RepID=A0AAN7DB19_9FUNG|nr:protein phosphatase regulator [Mucor velutinosus]
MLAIHEHIRLGRRINDKKSLKLFQNVIYSIDETLDEGQKQRLVNILINNGGTSSDQQQQPPNLFVSEKTKIPDVQSVTPLWVERAVVNGFVHDMSFYEPGKDQFLSGQVLLLLDLPLESKPIFDQINKFGGQYRDDFSQDVTCLVCIEPRGTYYNDCIERNIPVVLPQWLDDCLRYHHQFPYDTYRLPTPTIYYQHKPYPATIFKYPLGKQVSLLIPSKDLVRKRPLHNQVVYFGKDVPFIKEKKTDKTEEGETKKEAEALRQLWYSMVQEMGGTVAEEYQPYRVTIVILKYRSSLEYKQAVQDQKCIASCSWLSNTYCRGYLCSPMDTLLDYPIPKVGIAGMEKCVIALTGFKGVNREFLNRLIFACGAYFSAKLAKDTTYLICGGGYGDKYAELPNYPNVIRVNHLWLEDCYAQFRMIDYRSDRRYTYIPTDHALMERTVGHTRLMPHIIDRFKDDTYDQEPHTVYQEYELGFIKERKPRKAALRAQSVLNEHIIPDANAYEKEYKNKK